MFNLRVKKKKTKVKDIKYPFPVTQFYTDKKTSEHLINNITLNKQYNYKNS